MVELHDFEDGGHSLIVHALPIVGTLNLSLKLVKADKDLLDVLKVAIVLPSETLVLAQHIVS